VNEPVSAYALQNDVGAQTEKDNTEMIGLFLNVFF
jgi:hypothetical protein